METAAVNPIQLLEEARTAVRKHHAGAISYEEARAVVAKYGEVYTVRAKEIAKEYGQRFKPFSINAFMR